MSLYDARPAHPARKEFSIRFAGTACTNPDPRNGENSFHPRGRRSRLLPAERASALLTQPPPPPILLEEAAREGENQRKAVANSPRACIARMHGQKSARGLARRAYLLLA